MGTDQTIEFLGGVKVNQDPLNPTPAMCKCTSCNTVHKVADCETEHGYHDGHEMAPYTEILCSKCEDGGCIDDFFLDEKQEHAYIQELIRLNFIKETKEGLEPVKCLQCNSLSVKDKVTSTDDGHLSEYERSCKDCGNVMGYWAHGYWQN